MMAMCKIVLVSLCLISTVHAWRVHPSSKQWQGGLYSEQQKPLEPVDDDPLLHSSIGEGPIQALFTLLSSCIQTFWSRNASSSGQPPQHQSSFDASSWGRLPVSSHQDVNSNSTREVGHTQETRISSVTNMTAKIAKHVHLSTPAGAHGLLRMRGGEASALEGPLIFVLAVLAIIVVVSAVNSSLGGNIDDWQDIYVTETSIRAPLPASNVSRPRRILIDCSHEFLFRPPFQAFLQQCGYEVHTTQVGLRPDVVFAYDACVIWEGTMAYSDMELATLRQYVELGGGILISGTGKNVQSAAISLGLPPAPLCFDQALLKDESLRVVALESVEAESQDSSMLCQLFERLVAFGAGDDNLFSRVEDLKQNKLELDFCTICYPDSLAGERAEQLGAMAQETYDAVAEEFGYGNSEERMRITALLCCGAGWQASKYVVGIGCLGPQQAVQSVMIHEFSNSLCVELTSMGGDAGWSTYVQDKVKRKLGWSGYGKTVEQIHKDAERIYMAYEAGHGVVDPSSEDAYAHGANEAIIAKWKAIYTHYEIQYGGDIMHKYFHYAKECASFLIADGWDRIHDRMIVYFSLATGEDQTAFFESMGYVPSRRWSDEIRKMQECVVCSPWGCSGNMRPSGIPEEHPWNALAMILQADNTPEWAERCGFDKLGCQSISVQEAGCYLLEVAGAAGNAGGRGAVLTARVTLEADTKLKILTGQRATSPSHGGGGATVVWLNGKLLMVAGGGGTLDACLMEQGGDAYDEHGVVIIGSGGRNGHGGRSFMGQGGQGGAGWSSSALGDPEGPAALKKGGGGGHRWDPQAQSDIHGGLGGGGAEWYGSGGGGGYSGGSGCPPSGQSGGGGSWISNRAEEVTRQASNEGAGYVCIKIADVD